MIIKNKEYTSDPTVTLAIKAKFFTIPHAAPSGVSAGHINPHCVLCNCLGLVCLPPVSIGVFKRRKCDRLEEYVSLFNT